MNIGKEIAALQRLSMPQLRDRYAEAFGEATNANNKQWLLKRIAWRLQSLAEGGLEERAARRAAELANEADLRLSPPKPAAARTVVATLAGGDGTRLPPPGTIITRPYKGRLLAVKVLPKGFEYEAEVYGSLSSVAKAITGPHCNGFLFFKLDGKKESA